MPPRSAQHYACYACNVSRLLLCSPAAAPGATTVQRISRGGRWCSAGRLLAGFLLRASDWQREEHATVVVRLRPVCTRPLPRLAATNGTNTNTTDTIVRSSNYTSYNSTSPVFGVSELSTAIRTDLACPAGEWVVGWGGDRGHFISGLWVV
jgi:hypothetical protein